MINKLDSLLSFQQSALRVRGQRQELIASNIANADTPNYKAKDVEFGDAMKNAMNGGNSLKVSVAKTSDGHMDGINSSNDNAPGGPKFRKDTQGNVDGNTVDMDVERNQFADNGIRYEASLNMISGQVKEMLAAIQSNS
jgi:flagellar basal-body rod protein FlgB